MVSILKQPFMNGYAMGGDNDEVSVAGKGVRWGVAALIIIVVLIGVGIGYKLFTNSKTKVDDQTKKLTDTFNAADALGN